MLPTVRLTAPATPPLAAPLPMRTQPLFPDALMPLVIAMPPDTPATAASADASTIEPEPDDELLPLKMLTEPPLLLPDAWPPLTVNTPPLRAVSVVSPAIS